MQKFINIIYRLLWRVDVDILLIVSSLLIFWNLLIFVLFGIDKHRALKRKWRISELTLMICSLLCGGIGAAFGSKIFNHKTKKAKFKLVILLSLIITSVPFIHIVHSLTLDRIIVYREMDFFAPTWPKSLDGYRIGFMTDFHRITEDRMQEVVDELNQREIDLLVLGGDFSLYEEHYRTILGIISKTNTIDGIWGVEGNHDDYNALFAAKNDYGIGILDNSGQYIHPNFFLAGVHDLWNRQADIAYATNNADDNSFILLVSHNPDITMIQETSNLDLVVSGHTHGGQITLFGWPFVLHLSSVSNYGTRFGGGWSESTTGVPVYTSAGIGDYYIWPRIFARPEVIIFTMYHE